MWTIQSNQDLESAGEEEEAESTSATSVGNYEEAILWIFDQSLKMHAENPAEYVVTNGDKKVSIWETKGEPGLTVAATSSSQIPRARGK